MLVDLILVNARRETRDARRETRDDHTLNFSVYSLFYNLYYVYLLSIYLLSWIYSLIRYFYIPISKISKLIISVLFLSAFYKKYFILGGYFL